MEKKDRVGRALSDYFGDHAMWKADSFMSTLFVGSPSNTGERAHRNESRLDMGQVAAV